MRNLILTATALGTLTIATVANAGFRNCAIDYATFEDEVHHFDLEVCPAGFPNEETGFCRGALIGEDMHVYFFAYDDEIDRECLTQYKEVTIQDFMATKK